ncbi:MAG: hypothetical protein WD081_04140 [Gammaproteobacteria bacterium]
MSWLAALFFGFWIIFLIVHLETGAYSGIWNVTIGLVSVFLVLMVVMSIKAMVIRKRKKP